MVSWLMAMGIWMPKGTFQLIDMGHECYIVNFCLPQDFHRSLEVELWFLGEKREIYFHAYYISSCVVYSI